MRRECLDWIFPLGENHLRSVLSEWRDHYNCGRPHVALGPGLPEPPEGLPAPLQPDRHRLPDNVRVLSKPILGGLHHEYRLDQAA
jgi:putative transposase